jgi:putative addiction module CopG family antidote
MEKSFHVVWMGLSGRKDWELKPVILDGDWTFVTKNPVDFRGPASRPGSKGQYADVAIHAGLICLNAPKGIDLDAPAGRTGVDRPSTVCGYLPRIFLAGGPPCPMMAAMNAVTLPPDLERFADEVIAKGRFRDVDEVVRAGVSLLQRAEAERAAFEASLDNAIAEGERDGFLTLDEVMHDADALLEEMSNSRR